MTKITFEVKDQILEDILKAAFGPQGAQWVTNVRFLEPSIIRFTESEYGVKRIVTAFTIAEGISLFLTKNGSLNMELAYTDGPTADCYLQYGIFGEIKYG